MSNETKTKQTTAKLSLVEPVPFDGTSECKHVTNVNLAMYINALFKSAFKDCIGCTITPNTTGSGDLIDLDVYFAPGGDNGKGSKLSAFAPAGVSVNTPAVDSQKKFNYVAMAMQHNYRASTTSSQQITAEAVELLYDLMSWSVKGNLKKSPKSFADCGVVLETAIPGQYGTTKPQVYNIVRKVDINAVMKIIFGGESNNYEFLVTPVKPVMTAMAAMPGAMPVDGKWLYAITKLDREAVADLSNELGFYNKVSDLGIVTDTF